LHKIGPVNPQRLIKALMKIGFRSVRQSGSHVILINERGVRTVIPIHPGRDVKPALVLAIMKEIGLEREEFLKLLENA